MKKPLRYMLSVMLMLALMLSNGLVALSGALLAQYQGSSDINMGRGAIVIGLAAVIIGEVMFGKVFRNIGARLLAVSIGAIVYYIVLQIVLQIGLNTNDLKLITALIVALFLTLSYLNLKKTRHKVIGNKSASGTVILDELGEEEIATGHMIVYTSADSVMQICGNEETFDLKELYRCCEIARELTLKDEWRVGRVIARPYVGKKRGEFVRTSNRHDYALKPTGLTALNALKDAGYSCISVGKIYDIFDSEGLTESNKSQSSVHGMEQTIDIAGRDFKGLCFTNLVDFDALWGHRRNPIGYGEEIERFDVKLGELLNVLRKDDLLILTADHGNDPTYTGTDHTRETVPMIAYSPSMKASGILKERDAFHNFAVLGATITENFGVNMPEGTIGESILDLLQ